MIFVSPRRFYVYVQSCQLYPVAKGHTHLYVLRITEALHDLFFTQEPDELLAVVSVLHL